MADKWPDKDPDAHKDYAIDWTERLEEAETITDSEWFDDSDGDLTLEDGSISDGVCTIWIEGGETGSVYNVTNRITTSRGLIDDKTAKIRIREQ